MSVAFRPVLIEGNVNVSRRSPLKEFFKLLAGIAVTAVAAYILLGMIVNAVVPFIPASVENRIGSLYTGRLKKSLSLREDKKTRRILDTLLTGLINNRYNITISVAPSPAVNAAALPGGHIVIFEGLLKRVESERELAFVIGHEIGHFMNRDHLRGLGRRLSIALIAAILGNENRLSEAIVGSIDITGLRYSQKQESRADSAALVLLCKAYGSAEGGVSFFEKLSKEEKIPEFAYFFSTHPSPQKRIDFLKAIIEKEMSEQ